jgi:hypothetical protein
MRETSGKISIYSNRSEERRMKKTSYLGGFLTLIALILNFQAAMAHESITVGNYEIELGWASEPPVAGQPNAIEIHVTNNSTGEAQPVEDISSLTVTISYGGQSKELTFEPLGDHDPGHFQAVIVPTVPGKYTVHFGGTLGDTPADVKAEPEEVQPADTLQFPSVDSAQSESGGFDMTEWLAIAGLVTGLVALVLSLFNMRRSR